MATKENELTTEQKLQLLAELQKSYSKIDELRALLGELPMEVKDKADEIEGLKTRLTNIEAEIKEFETNISNEKVEMETSNAKIARYEEQINSVQNNLEYNSLNKQIGYEKECITACQKHIKEFTAGLEEKKSEKEETIKNIEDSTIELNSREHELDDILNETKEKTEKLMLQAQDLEKKMTDDRLLTAFKRIRKNAHNGLAVVTVERDACGGCHNKIPAQRQLDIRLRKKIIVCEYCGRILVDPELAGVSEDK